MPNFNREKPGLIILGLTLCFLVACNFKNLATGHGGLPLPKTIKPTTERGPELFSLPASLYYLQTGQIWQLNQDAHTLQQITHEEGPIDSYDFSLAMQMLVYVSDNKLIISNADGGGRQVLLSGPELTASSDELARLNSIEHITSAIRSPHWSPDGKQIGFIQYGVQVLTLSNNQTQQIWSQSTASSEPMLVESLRSWSPDGQYLLVNVYSYPIDRVDQIRLGLLQMDGPLYTFDANAQITFAWSPGMTHLYLANSFAGSEKALMRCDLPDSRCTMIAEFEPARWYYAYAHPFITADDQLLVFMGSTNDFSQRPQSFQLISTRLDGQGRNTIRRDGYLPGSALWSPQGDGVLIILEENTDDFQAGSLLWLSTNGLPAKLLPATQANNLQWGFSLE